MNASPDQVGSRVVLGREGDVVDVASRLDLLPKKLEVIVFLLSEVSGKRSCAKPFLELSFKRWSRKLRIKSASVLPASARLVVAQVVNQVRIRAARHGAGSP